MHLGQLTDTHVVGPSSDDEHYADNNERLRVAVRSLNAEVPQVDAVVVTGDLTNSSEPPAYEILAHALGDVAAPCLVLPGNHDSRELTRSTFPDMGWVDAEHLSWVHCVGAGPESARVIGLDSTRPGYHGAQFDEERAAWLDSILADPHDGATILALHHPPFRTGIGWMDRAGFDGLERFADVVTGRGITKIICGHLHRPISGIVGGVPAQIGLSPVQHVALDLRDDADPSLVLDPVGYQIHRLADGHVVSHTRYIDTDAEPFVPDWAAGYDPTAPV